MSRAAILEASILPALVLCAAACREPARAGPPAPSPAVSATSAVLPSSATAFSGKLAADGRSSSGRADLDGDGAEDCWEARYEGGSGSGGDILKIESPCGGPASTIDTTSSSGSFLALTALPPAIGARPRLVEGIIDLLYGRSHLRHLGASGGTIDGSFHRLLDHYLTVPGPASPPFAATGKYTPVWSPGPPMLPTSQVVVLSDPAYRPLASSLKPIEDLPPAAPYAWLAYHAHNHHGLKQVARCGPRSVYATDHGVIVHDTDKDTSSWVVLSTDVTKLRHPSIGQVACAASLVAADRRSGDGAWELVVAEARTGRYGRIPLEEPWSLDERALTVGKEPHAIEDVARALSGP